MCLVLAAKAAGGVGAADGREQGGHVCTTQAACFARRVVE